MKAVRIHEEGGPDVLRYEDVPEPQPGAGEVLVKLEAASLNRLDVWIRKGMPSVPKPRILGADGAGTVVERGEGVEKLEEGQRVVLNPGLDDGNHIIGEHMDGTHAEFIVAPADYVHALPDDVSTEAAAAFPLVFETAYRMLVTKARITEDDWVLVWGIGGGVATASFQIAKAFGASVITTSSAEEKLQKARELGADATANHDTSDVAAIVKEATGGRGADIVVETVGETTWKTSLAVAARDARITVCGATSGPNPPAQLHRVWWKQLTIFGSTMGTREDFAGAFELVKSGRATPIVDQVYPLSDAAAAHERLENGDQFGKIILVPD